MLSSPLPRRKWKRSSLAAILAMVAALTSVRSEVRAGETLSVAAAEELYRQGNVAYRAGRLQEAYALYTRAWVSKRSFDIAGNLGAVELELGKKRDAAEHLTLSYRAFPVNGSAEARARTEELLAEARQGVVSLQLDMAYEGAEVKVDSAWVGLWPLQDPIFLEPGVHQVGVSKRGRRPWFRELRGKAGDTLRPRVVLERESLREDRPTDPSSMPDAVPWPLVVSGGSVGVIALGAGVGLLIASHSKAQTADRLLQELRPTGLCPNAIAGARCQDLLDLRAEKDSLQNWGVPTLVSGVGVLTGTALLALWPRDLAASGTWRVSPWFAGQAQGLTCDGGF